MKEIPESASVTTSEDGTSLTIAGYTGTLKAGDIIAVHEVFPVIYSVTAVTSADGVLTLTVTKLDADDYILSMNTQGSVDADLSEVEAAEDTEITYIMSNGAETQSAARARALLRDKRVKIKDVKLDKTLYNSGGIKVKVYGNGIFGTAQLHYFGLCSCCRYRQDLGFCKGQPRGRGNS